MIIFPDKAALDYDQRIQGLVPGYGLALSLMGLKLSQITQVNQNSDKPLRILIVGCGTGSEILTLAPLLPSALFYALDPSKGMIDMAQQRLKAANLAQRVTFIQGFIDDCKEEAFDGISLSLVLHFIPQNEKTKFLQKLAQKIRPNGFLMMFDARLDKNDDLLEIWLANQHDKREAMTIINRIKTNWARISQEDMVDLLQVTGFTTPSLLFQACCFQLSLSFKAMA